MENLKLTELERRIKLLENRMEKSRFNYFTANKKSESSAKTHEYNFELIVKSACYLNVEIAVNCAIEGFLTQIYVNGVNVMNYKNCPSAFIFSRVLPFDGGKNVVTVKFESESDFNVNYCNFSTFGDIEYPELKSILSVINETDRSIVLFLVNGQLRIKIYSDQLQTIIAKSGVISACICKMDIGYLLTVVNEAGEAINYLYDSSFNAITEFVLDDEITSVCSISGSQATLFAVKGSSVYRYLIDESFNVVVTKTQYRAKKVASNPSLNRYIIITDHAGNGKIVKIN